MKKKIKNNAFPSESPENISDTEIIENDDELTPFENVFDLVSPSYSDIKIEDQPEKTPTESRFTNIFGNQSLENISAGLSPVPFSPADICLDKNTNTDRSNSIIANLTNDIDLTTINLSVAKPGDTESRIVSSEESGWRLDLFLAHYFPKYSRVLLRKAIQAGGVSVDGKGGKPAFRLKPGQTVVFTLPELPRESPLPENIPLEILYEDDDLAVVNKPANMVVHPSRGHWAGTLVGALAFRYAGQLSSVRGPARPGIVHRLDRDTSGAILIAKNDVAHARLAAQFQERRIQKEYWAIVLGCPNVDRDMIDLPIAHHPKNREKMMIARPESMDVKPAQTFFEVMERFRGFSLIRALPKTGRTHQIRVHLTAKGCPILCDRLYGGRTQILLGEIIGKIGQPISEGNGRLLRSNCNLSDSEELNLSEILLNRQALHARKIRFEHPETGQTLEIEAPLPSDFVQTLNALRCWRQTS